MGKKGKKTAKSPSAAAATNAGATPPAPPIAFGASLAAEHGVSSMAEQTALMAKITELEAAAVTDEALTAAEDKELASLDDQDAADALADAAEATRAGVSDALMAEMARDLDAKLETATTEAEKLEVARQAFIEEAVSEAHLKSVMKSRDRLSRRVAILTGREQRRLTEAHVTSDELRKVKAVKDKLETLCKELRRQNLTIMENAKEVSEADDARRKDLGDKFNATIEDVTAKLAEQAEQRTAQMAENDDLRTKLGSLLEKFDQQEQANNARFAAKDIEVQLAEAKLEQQLRIVEAETTRSQIYEEKIKHMQNTELELRKQLTFYAEKFDTFQSTLTSSNDMFTEFKDKMESMGKTITTLERDNTKLRRQKETTDGKLGRFEKEQKKHEAELAKAQNQKAQLQKLCSHLRDERTAHITEIRTLKADRAGGGDVAAAGGGRGGDAGGSEDGGAEYEFAPGGG